MEKQEKIINAFLKISKQRRIVDDAEEDNTTVAQEPGDSEEKQPDIPRTGSSKTSEGDGEEKQPVR